MGNLVVFLNKKFGEGTVVLPDAVRIDKDKIIPSGSILLDRAIGPGGYPTKRFIELYGAEGVGKSTLCLHAAANTQRKGKVVVYVDFENTFEPDYAKRIGVDLDPEKFILTQPDAGEDGLSLATEVLKYPEVGLVIIDSIAAMVPLKESEAQSELTDQTVGLAARVITKWLRRTTPLLANSEAAIIIVNQVRDKISTMSYGPTEGKATPGGGGLKHMGSLRIELSRKAYVREKDEVIGVLIQAHLVKNKLNVPYQKVTMEIVRGHGINIHGEILELMIEKGLIIKSGSWYKDAEGNSLGQGAKGVYEWMNNNPDIVNQFMEQEKISSIYATDLQRSE